jgi:hypothetical protein
MADADTEAPDVSVSSRALRAHFGGDLLLSGEGNYEALRAVFNAMIDKRPAMIARCANAHDVALAVKFSRDHNLRVAVRGGGHSIAGKSVCDDGLLIDLSTMKGLSIDVGRQVATAEPGLRLGELDQGTQAFGLATPLGIVSSTGIAGLTLGGGIGWLNGKFGLACDNLISADVVIADGKLLTANSAENADLLWGLRGGGGNFGIVTRFEYRLHVVNEVLGGMLVFDIRDAKNVLLRFHDLARGCPDELSMVAALLTQPVGILVLAIVVCYAGSLRIGEQVIQSLRQLGPVDDQIRPMSYLEMQSLLDGAFPLGRRHYWKSSFIRHISEDAIDTLLCYCCAKPSPLTTVALQHIHGAAARIGPSETAFPHRADQYDLGILAQWSDPADSNRNFEWTRAFWDAMRPFSEPSVYVNNLGEEGHDRVREAYGLNYGRLLELKNKYDPTNLFSLNQNIPPGIAH